MNKESINELLKDHQELHSEFQIANFIIGNQGDDWAQYKQCLREIKARVGSIDSDKIKLQISESNRNGQKLGLLKRLFHRKIKVNEMIGVDNLTSLKDVIKERERELKCFLKLAENLKQKIGEITPERRQQLELKSWTAKGRRMAAIDRILTGRISHQTFEFILSLPIESQHSILDKILPDDPERRLLIESLNERIEK